jgi:hypothetical protein
MSHILAGLVLITTVGAQTLRMVEIRKPVGSATGKLVATVDGREANLSNDAARAWEGWHPDIVIFTEVLHDGSEALRAFNGITGALSTITTEQLSIHDITVARLQGGDYTLVLFARDKLERPWLVLAHPRKGTFRRIPNVTAGAIVNDTVEVRFFDPGDLKARGKDVRELQPSRISIIPLRAEAGVAGVRR